MGLTNITDLKFVSIYLCPHIIRLSTRCCSSEAEAIRTPVRIGGGQPEGADPARGALLPLHVRLAETRAVAVTLTQTISVTL